MVNDVTEVLDFMATYQDEEDVNKKFKQNLKDIVGDCFFSVRYYSNSKGRYENYGSLLLNVKKHLKGGKSTAKEHTFTAYDLSAKHYRSFVISKTAFVKCGKLYTQDAILSGKKNVI